MSTSSLVGSQSEQEIYIAFLDDLRRLIRTHKNSWMEIFEACSRLEISKAWVACTQWNEHEFDNVLEKHVGFRKKDVRKYRAFKQVNPVVGLADVSLLLGTDGCLAVAEIFTVNKQMSEEHMKEFATEVISCARAYQAGSKVGNEVTLPPLRRFQRYALTIAISEKWRLRGMSVLPSKQMSTWRAYGKALKVLEEIASLGRNQSSAAPSMAYAFLIEVGARTKKAA